MMLNQLIKSDHESRPSSQMGFTLMELMITVSIAGILTGLAVPSFNAIIRSSRLTTYTNEFVTALNLARSEAVKRGMSVTVRKIDSFSSTKLVGANWEDGWDVFTDVNSDSKFAAGDVLIKTSGGFNASYTLRGSGLLANYVRFGPDGASTTGSLVLCDDSDGNGVPEANTSRLITLVTTGRVRIMPDTNGDGIPNKNATTNIQLCSPPF
ncbi:MAG: GspH/FimT family pseudopilin [Methyloglobulus sp.]|nr:prepilin-type N-terminal cleavage/methylation domain-containing protein [Methyloglobulus sp.]